MFAISRRTSTACSVTSGPTPSPGSVTIFSFMRIECHPGLQDDQKNNRKLAGLMNETICFLLRGFSCDLVDRLSWLKTRSTKSHERRQKIVESNKRYLNR